MEKLIEREREREKESENGNKEVGQRKVYHSYKKKDIYNEHSKREDRNLGGKK